jgi:hypothetical protein
LVLEIVDFFPSYYDSICAGQNFCTKMNSWLCPITGDVMLDPVLVVESGHSYEREAIMKWLEQGTEVRDPITNMLLPQPVQIATNHALRQCIHESILVQDQNRVNDPDDKPREGAAESLEAQLLEAKDLIRRLKEKGQNRNDRYYFNLSFAAGGLASIITLFLLILVAQLREQCICIRQVVWFSSLLVLMAATTSASLSGPCLMILTLLDASWWHADKSMPPRLGVLQVFCHFCL